LISFITNYDDATLENYNTYQTLVLPVTIALSGYTATQLHLSDELRLGAKNVFIMSHGNHDKVSDQNENNVFTTPILDLLSKKNVFAYACNSANILGEIASKKSITWCGFKEPINSPTQDVELISIYQELFRFIFSEYVKVKCDSTAITYLEELKLLCTQKMYDLDDLVDSNYYASISTYQSIKQLWEKQKIWLANNNQYTVHRDSPPELVW